MLHKLKSTTILRRVPITILTSSREAGDRAMSYDLGASSCQVTSISFEGFIHLARSIMGYWIGLNVAPPET